MEQQRALNALEPYIALSKSATSPRAAADLITQATSSPQTYVFAELLQTPNIQALRQSSEYASYLTLLEIFAWGTYQDYTCISSPLLQCAHHSLTLPPATPNLPPLAPPQHQKLLLLSLLPLCTSPTTLTYSALQTALFPTLTPSTPPADLALESLVISALYASLLTAHLDPLSRTVRVTSISPLRDVPPAGITPLLSTLKAWEARCTSTLSDIETQITEIKARARDKRMREVRNEKAFDQKWDREERFEQQMAAETAAHLRGGQPQGTMGKLLGLVGAGKGGKRAAPTGDGVGGFGSVGDVMDLDDGGGTRGGARGVKRQGRAAR